MWRKRRYALVLPNWCTGVVPWYWCSGEAAFLLHLLSSFYEAAFISLGAMVLYNYTVFLYEAAYLCSMGMVLRKQRECFHLHQNSLFSFLFRFSFHTKTTIVRSGSRFLWCFALVLWLALRSGSLLLQFWIFFCILRIVFLRFLCIKKNKILSSKPKRGYFLVLGLHFREIWLIFMLFLCSFFSIFYFPKITILYFLFLCDVDVWNCTKLWWNCSYPMRKLCVEVIFAGKTGSFCGFLGSFCIFFVTFFTREGNFRKLQNLLKKGSFFRPILMKFREF